MKRSLYPPVGFAVSYLSKKRNVPYLLTWYDYYELGIPNTSNGLEGKFTDLKSKLRNHNGLFIEKYFKATFEHYTQNANIIAD